MHEGEGVRIFQRVRGGWLLVDRGSERPEREEVRHGAQGVSARRRKKLTVQESRPKGELTRSHSLGHSYNSGSFCPLHSLPSPQSDPTKLASAAILPFFISSDNIHRKKCKYVIVHFAESRIVEHRKRGASKCQRPNKWDEAHAHKTHTARFFVLVCSSH